METSEKRFYHLLSLKVSGEANSDELKELDDILKNYPSLSLEAEMVKRKSGEKK